MKTRNSSQTGLASILFAMIMVIVLSLMAVGFATIARSDQRQTQDKTLSNQATYAAETAINRAATDIRNRIMTGLPVTNDSTCAADQSPVARIVTNDVEVTCVLIDATPLKLDTGASSTPTVIPIKPDGLNSVNKIRVTWRANNTSRVATYGSATRLDFGVANAIPTLRITASPSSNIGNISTVYARPISSGTGSVSFGTGAASGGIGSAACSAGLCTLTLAITTGPWTSANTGILSIVSLDGDSSVTVEGLNAADAPVELYGAQVAIDATARAGDVIKRLVANIAYSSTTWRPSAALVSGDLCKNYRLDGVSNDQIGPVGVACSSIAAPTATGADDAIISTPPASSSGAPLNYPYWDIFGTISDSTIPDARRASCSWQAVYSANNATSPSSMRRIGPVIVKYGTDCYNGKTQMFTVGDNAVLNCTTQPDCNQPGYYNLEFYLRSDSGIVIGPRYRMSGGILQNSCRPRDSSWLCQLSP